MPMSQPSSLAFKLLMLMFMVMLALQVRIGLNVELLEGFV